MSLLAIAFLASTAYAGRFDPSLHTKNLHSASGGGFIPYLECIAKCDECTPCTLMWPMWINLCVCVNHTESAISEQPVLQSSEKVFLVKGKSEDGSVPKNPTAAAAAAVQKAPTEEPTLIPFDECAKKCKGVCVCPLIWPPPKFCSCFATIKSSSPTVTVEKILVKEHEKSLEEEEYSGPIPYTECIKTCKYCACTVMWPPESNWCICSMPKKPVAEEKKELLAGLVEKGTGGGGCMPYQECKAKCDYECIPCTKMWPPEINSHVCLSLTDSANLKKPALQNYGGDDKQIVLWTKANMETMTRHECIKTCKVQCACTLPWPPGKEICVCGAPKSRDECTKTCRKQCACTLPWPPGTEICVCGAPKSQAAGGKALPV